MCKVSKNLVENSTTFGLGFAGTEVQFHTSVPLESVSFTKKRQLTKKLYLSDLYIFHSDRKCCIFIHINGKKFDKFHC